MDALFGHPHIVGIIASGYTGADLPYIVMEDMTGGSLAAAIRARGHYGWQEALQFGLDLCSALEAAHTAHILHRDVKPENALFSRYGSIKLGDFGLASLAEGPETRTTASLVSLAHTAPEILDGAPRTASTDIYALASTMMTMLIGRPPFGRQGDESTASVVKRIAVDPPPDLRDRGVPSPACDALERALAKAPDQRYASAAAFRSALNAANGPADPRVVIPPRDADRTETYRAVEPKAPTSAPARPDDPPTVMFQPPPPAAAPPVWATPVRPATRQRLNPALAVSLALLGLGAGVIMFVGAGFEYVVTGPSVDAFLAFAPITVIAAMSLLVPRVRRTRAASVFAGFVWLAAAGCALILGAVLTASYGAADPFEEPAFAANLAGDALSFAASLVLVGSAWAAFRRRPAEPPQSSA